MQKLPKKCVQLATRRGFYLGPPWTILAEILGDNSPIVGLPCVRISLGCVKVCGSSGRKCPKKGAENQFFEKVPYRYDGEIFLYRTKMVPRGPRLNKKKFSFGGVFWVFGRVETQNDMLCTRLLCRFLTVGTLYSRVPSTDFSVLDTALLFSGPKKRH